MTVVKCSKVVDSDEFRIHDTWMVAKLWHTRVFVLSVALRDHTERLFTHCPCLLRLNKH